MILTKHFVWIHVPRTGGTWFRSVMKVSHVPEWDVWIGAGHKAHDSIPKQWKNLPRLAGTRNPWAWYVSHFYCWKEQYETKKKLYKGPQEVWEPFAQEWADRLERTRSSDERVWFEHAMADFMVPGQPSLTGTTKYLVGDMSRCSFIRVEGTPEHLIAALNQTCTVPSRLQYQLRNAAPVNNTQSRNYRDFYRPAIRDLVAEIDRETIERFGYEF